MTGLPALQDAFQSYLRHRPSDIAEHVRPGPRTTVEVGLGVYRDAYALRLIEALGEDFTALRAWLGDDAFAALVRGYLDRSPSRAFTVRELGRDLPAHLAATAPWNAHRFAHDLARFEWALRDLFDGPDDTALTFAGLVETMADQLPSLRFRPIACVRRIELLSGVPGFWVGVDAGMPAAPDPGEPCAWLLWRPALVTEFRSLDADEAWAFDALAAGAPFMALCEGLAHWHEGDQAALRAAGLLRAWLDAGLIADATPT